MRHSVPTPRHEGLKWPPNFRLRCRSRRQLAYPLCRRTAAGFLCTYTHTRARVSSRGSFLPPRPLPYGRTRQGPFSMSVARRNHVSVTSIATICPIWNLDPPPP
ncbi:unnamed protein product, partial [Ectocarpus sp. 4 AP-2014]